MKFRQAAPELTLIIGIAACIDLTTELSRVAIPGTKMAVVLSEDEKHLYRYQLIDEGRPITSEILLGGLHSPQPPPVARVTAAAELITVEWLTDVHKIQVVINPSKHRVVQGDVLLRDSPQKSDQLSP